VAVYYHLVSYEESTGGYVVSFLDHFSPHRDKIVAENGLRSWGFSSTRASDLDVPKSRVAMAQTLYSRTTISACGPPKTTRFQCVTPDRNKQRF